MREKQTMLKRTRTAAMIVLAGLAWAGCTVDPRVPGPNLTIYGDAVASGWTVYSSWLTYDLNCAAPVYAGDRSIAITYSGDGSLAFERTDAPIDAAWYGAIRFRIHGGASGGQYTAVVVYNGNGVPVINTMITPDPAAGVWQEKSFAIPLSAGSDAVDYIEIVHMDDFAVPTLYVDEIELVGR